MEKILQKYEKNNSIHVERFTHAPAVAAGNNYASMLLRSNVKYKKDGKACEKSLIIKTAVSDPEMAKSIAEYGIYQREVLMYDRILPQFHRLLESYGDHEKLFPEAIYADTKNSTLIFEDLKEKGFSLADRLNGVDQNHVDLVIRKIAKFHACSMVLVENGIENFNEFRKPPFTDDGSSKKYFDGMSKAFLEQIQTWPGYEMYVKKFENVQKWLPKETISLYGDTKYPISVLAHGDLWVNNMMFKYDEEKKVPVELLMVR